MNPLKLQWVMNCEKARPEYPANLFDRFQKSDYTCFHKIQAGRDEV